jgi:hypothetical protein
MSLGGQGAFVVKDLNCHFISRILTRPWEFGQRRLHFYDKKTKRFHQTSSKKLFARRGLNSKKTEEHLEHIMETPLARALPQLLNASDAGSGSITDWPTYRALMLLYPFQLARITPDRSPPIDLESLCSWPDEALDQYVRVMEQSNRLITAVSHRECPFFYPSKGYFIVPLRWAATPHPGAIAMPLTERHAVVWIPAGVDDDLVHTTLSKGEGALVTNASIGTNSERVVIHPSIMKHANLDDLRAHIEEMQDCNLTDIQTAVNINTTIFAAYARAGLGRDTALAWMRGEKKATRGVDAVQPGVTVETAPSVRSVAPSQLNTRVGGQLATTSDAPGARYLAPPGP